MYFFKRGEMNAETRGLSHLLTPRQPGSAFDHSRPQRRQGLAGTDGSRIAGQRLPTITPRILPQVRKSARCGVNVSTNRPASSVFTPWTRFDGTMNPSPAESVCIRPSIVTSKSPFGDVARLDMRMRVERADTALLESELHHHQFVGVKDHTAAIAVSRCGPFAFVGTGENLGFGHRSILIAPASRHRPERRRHAYTWRPAPTGKRQHRRCRTARPSGRLESARGSLRSGPDRYAGPQYCCL